MREIQGLSPAGVALGKGAVCPGWKLLFEKVRTVASVGSIIITLFELPGLYHHGRQPFKEVSVPGFTIQE